jgi:hypothetical protein
LIALLFEKGSPLRWTKEEEVRFVESGLPATSMAHGLTFVGGQDFFNLGSCFGRLLLGRVWFFLLRRFLLSGGAGGVA